MRGDCRARGPKVGVGRSGGKILSRSDTHTESYLQRGFKRETIDSEYKRLVNREDYIREKRRPSNHHSKPDSTFTLHRHFMTEEDFEK